MTKATKKISWPADKVERRKLDSLTPYARNSRTHSDEQVAQIAASIKEWGFTTPILIEPDGGIIAGHGRVMAAQRLGLNEVPVVVAGDWTDAQKRAYVIADNKITLNAGWDKDLLAIEFEDLKNLDFDLELTGFGSDELTQNLDGENLGGGEEDYFDVDDTSPEESGPRATDDDYSVYELVMKHENKTLLISALNKVKAEQGFNKQEDALMHLVNLYL